jgi:4-hydroxythreonine-4-phosphate dehydrogenase
MNEVARPRLAVTPGEPAGIGPDLVIQLAHDSLPADLVAVADPDLLAERAALLGLPLRLRLAGKADDPSPAGEGELSVLPVPLAAAVAPGSPNPANAGYVLECLQIATRGCLERAFDALVTGPVHKATINEAGIAFSGHTEYLARLCGVDQTVMLLAAGSLRVALATTHLPLAAVSAALTRERLEAVLRILARDLSRRFALDRPRISVLGLNPHAGEGGHLGREEIEVIVPVLEKLRGEGLQLAGPLPADTAFTPAALERTDAVLAMYHDQGLPMVKARGFGHAVNITLGLPILRTSVDHGTALALAGSGHADPGSLRSAVAAAIDLARRAQTAHETPRPAGVPRAS